jgi:hypothetical protein
VRLPACHSRRRDHREWHGRGQHLRTVLHLEWRLLETLMLQVLVLELLLLLDLLLLLLELQLLLLLMLELELLLLLLDLLLLLLNLLLLLLLQLLLLHELLWDWGRAWGRLLGHIRHSPAGCLDELQSALLHQLELSQRLLPGRLPLRHWHVLVSVPTV